MTRKSNSSKDLQRKSRPLKEPPEGVPVVLYRAVLDLRGGQVLLQTTPATRVGSRYRVVRPADDAPVDGRLTIVATPREHRRGFTRTELAARHHAFPSPGAAVANARGIAARVEDATEHQLRGIRACIKWLADWQLAAAAATERVARERGVRVLPKEES